MKLWLYLEIFEEGEVGIKGKNGDTRVLKCKFVV